MPERTENSDAVCRTHHGPVLPRDPHGHGHTHSHEHGELSHPHPAPHTHSIRGVDGHRPKQRRALALCLILTTVTMIAETVGGFMTGSLMLLSDAVHMFSHAVSLSVSYFAIWMAARPRTSRSHYGFFRAEILASFVNGLGLVLLALWIMVEAVERLNSPIEVAGGPMIAVALIGLIVNLATVWILGRSHAEDLNTKSALLHMIGDLFSSVVIVIGGVVLMRTGWVWLDPALSCLVALVILWWSVGLLRSSCSILLERTPEGIEPDEVLETIRTASGVRTVHDLHVWEITSGYVCLTAHVVVDDTRVSETDGLRSSICDLLWSRFKVAHVTLQIEAPESAGGPGVQPIP